MQVDATVQKAFEMACNAQKNAHAPYSNFKVGAAVKIKNSDKIYPGSNVENASYGATVCAERVAIWSSVAIEGKPEFESIVIVTDTDPAIGPCALCLQVFAEFCEPDFEIYLANPKGIQQKVLFKDLLPAPFSYIPDTPDSLK
jgi:cytidine deaminase